MQKSMFPQIFPYAYVSGIVGIDFAFPNGLWSKITSILQFSWALKQSITLYKFFLLILASSKLAMPTALR